MTGGQGGVTSETIEPGLIEKTRDEIQEHSRTFRGGGEESALFQEHYYRQKQLSSF